MSLESVIAQIQAWHHQGLKVVLVTGVFDLLHIEHLHFLEAAKKAGDKLVVGLETDVRVRQIKGPNRPINPQTVRLAQLEALKAVDLAFILPQKFDSPDAWSKLLTDLQPDIYAVSSHSSHLENKQKLCKTCGVDFRIVYQYQPGFSTSSLITQLKT